MVKLSKLINIAKQIKKCNVTETCHVVNLPSKVHTNLNHVKTHPPDKVAMETPSREQTFLQRKQMSTT